MKKLEPVRPNYEGFLRNLRREGTPERVYYFEHGIATEIQEALNTRFGFWDGLNPAATDYEYRKAIRVHRFLGQEVFRVFPKGARLVAPKREGQWAEETAGAITTWEEFENYPWPRAEDADYSVLEFFEKELPDDMRVFHVVDIWEVVVGFFGFESLAYAIYDDRGLVNAMFEKIFQFVEAVTRAVCDFRCYGAVYLGDDLAFKSSLFMAPDLLRELIVPLHKKIADIAHEHEKLFLFHCCGQMYELIDEYIDVVKIDAKHSFEEVVMPVTEVKRRYGDRLTLLGGMDVDFLARSTPDQIRRKTRDILEVCVPGGGYFLGSGNWVTHYIPSENYLAMIEEGRRFNTSCSQKTGR